MADAAAIREAAQQAAAERVAEHKNDALDAAVAAKTIWVGHIPDAVASEFELRRRFSAHGTVVSAGVRTKPGTGKSWALVTFDSTDSARRASAAATEVPGLDGKMQRLKVRAANVGHELATHSHVTGHALSDVAARQEAKVAQDGELLLRVAGFHTTARTHAALHVKQQIVGSQHLAANTQHAANQANAAPADVTAEYEAILRKKTHDAEKALKAERKASELALAKAEAMHRSALEDAREAYNEQVSAERLARAEAEAEAVLLRTKVDEETSTALAKLAEAEAAQVEREKSLKAKEAELSKQEAREVDQLRQEVTHMQQELAAETSELQRVRAQAAQDADARTDDERCRAAELAEQAAVTRTALAEAEAMSKAHAQAVKAVENAAAEKALARKQAEEQAVAHAKDREAFEIHFEHVQSEATAAMSAAAVDAAAKVEAANKAILAADAVAVAARAELSEAREALSKQQHEQLHPETQDTATGYDEETASVATEASGTVVENLGGAASLALEPEQEMLVDWLNDGQEGADDRWVIGLVSPREEPRQQKQNADSSVPDFSSKRKHRQQLRAVTSTEHVSTDRYLLSATSFPREQEPLLQSQSTLAVGLRRRRRRRRVVPRVGKLLTEETLQPSKQRNRQQRAQREPSLKLTKGQQRAKRVRERMLLAGELDSPKPPVRPEPTGSLESFSEPALDGRTLTPTATSSLFLEQSVELQEMNAAAGLEETEALSSEREAEQERAIAAAMAAEQERQRQTVMAEQEAQEAAAMELAKAEAVAAKEALAAQWQVAAAEAVRQDRKCKLERERQRVLLAEDESARVAAENLALKTQLAASREAAQKAKAAADEARQAKLDAERSAAKQQAALAARLARERAEAAAETQRIRDERDAELARLAAENEARNTCSAMLDWIVSEVVRIKDEDDTVAVVQARIAQAKAAQAPIAEQAEVDRRRLIVEREAADARAAAEEVEAARVLAEETAARIKAKEEMAAQVAAATIDAIAHAKVQQAQLTADQEPIAQKNAHQDTTEVATRAHTQKENTMKDSVSAEEEADAHVESLESESCVSGLVAAEVTGKMLAEQAASQVMGRVVRELVQDDKAAAMKHGSKPEPERQNTPGSDRRRESKLRWRNASQVLKDGRSVTRGSSLRKAIQMAGGKQKVQQCSNRNAEEWLNSHNSDAVVWFLHEMTYETLYDKNTGTGGWMDTNGWVYDLRISLNVAAEQKRAASLEDVPDLCVTFEEGPAEFSADGLFALIDTDHSGSIEFVEFEDFWNDRKVRLGKKDEGSTCKVLKRAKQLFSEADVDNSGSLDRIEFETILAAVANDDATTAYVSEWIAHHLQTHQHSPADSDSALPSMGIKWNVPKGSEPLTIVSVAKGMAAAEKGLVEGMQLLELNGRSVDDIQFRKRDLSLDTVVVLEKMKARPLTLKLQAPALPGRESTPAVTVTFEEGPGVLSADGLFSLIDTDHSHTIDFAEFEQFWCERQKIIGKVGSNGDHVCDGTLERAKQLFAESDKDRSRTLDRQEFETILKDLAIEDWEAVQDKLSGRTYNANRWTFDTRWSHAGGASLNDWLDEHLRGDKQQGTEQVPELPSMGIKWNVKTSGDLVVAAVAKGMNASKHGVVEGMVLTRLNGDTVQDLRDSGLDTAEILKKMRSRPLTLQLQPPPPPVTPISCSGNAVWTLRNVGPSRHRALYEAKIGISETETLEGNVSGSEILLEGQVCESSELIAASKYSLRLRWDCTTATSGPRAWASELSGETVCHGVHTRVTLSRVSELPQPPFPLNWEAKDEVEVLDLPTIDHSLAGGFEATDGEVFLCVLRTIVREGCALNSEQAKPPNRSFLEIGDQVVVVECRKLQDGTERVRLECGGWVSRVSTAGRAILMSESQFFAPADTNSDGIVSKDEFVVWYLHAVGTPPSTEDYAIFYAADTNGDGTVSQTEFRKCQTLFLDAHKKAAAVTKQKTQVSHLHAMVETLAVAKLNKAQLLELAEPSKKIVHLDVQGDSLAEVNGVTDYREGDPVEIWDEDTQSWRLGKVEFIGSDEVEIEQNGKKTWLDLGAMAEREEHTTEKKAHERDGGGSSVDAGAGSSLSSPSVKEALKILRKPGRLEPEQRAFALFALSRHISEDSDNTAHIDSWSSSGLNTTANESLNAVNPPESTIRSNGSIRNHDRRRNAAEAVAKLQAEESRVAVRFFTSTHLSLAAHIASHATQQLPFISRL
eukprot:COSAG02_NODE_2827_length_7941_cov_15.962127_3_plen_2214_part_00